MAIYTCLGCNQIFSKRLVFTYMSWYEAETLIRYRLALCADCCSLLRDNAVESGFKRMDDGSWLGPQAILPGVSPATVGLNGPRTRI